MQSGKEPRGRVYFDFSTSLRWSGPPVGIVRVERELARWGRQHIPELTLVFFDPLTLRYRAVDPTYADFFIGGDATLDTLGLGDPARRRKSDRIPLALRATTLWLLQLRRKLLQTLERVRLTTRDPRRAAMMDRIQRRVMSPKYQAIMVKEDGSRRPFVPADLVYGKPITMRADDILVCAGASQGFTDIDVLRREKQRDGFRFAFLCYDVIPILFPHFYNPLDANAFRAYIEAALPVADLVVFNSRKVEADARSYCDAHAIPIHDTAVVPLGANFPRHMAEPIALPDRLQPGRYVMFVSTIEPRKGHRLLYNVWRRLVDEGVVAATGFKLVFIGRKGWMVDQLVGEIAGDDRVAGSLLHLEKVDDHTMAALYRGAAFCCYPSVYEGYGLPIVEAFHFGKAVLTSSGGSLPEVAGEYSPWLDPCDEEAWYRTMRQWIEDPALRVSYETKIETSFKHPTWEEAAALFFSHIDAQRRRAASGQP
jgi:glycosyltransferase involved in cell wall biosynthesis